MRTAEWALDLQLRGLGEETKLYRAALYVGTTKGLDIYLKGHSFALSAAATFANPDNGWDPAWEKRHDADWFAARWVEVDAYLQVEPALEHRDDLTSQVPGQVG
jgi:hypothetical protein